MIFCKSSVSSSGLVTVSDIAADMINWKTTLWKTVFISAQQ